VRACVSCLPANPPDNERVCLGRRNTQTNKGARKHLSWPRSTSTMAHNLLTIRCNRVDDRKQPCRAWERDVGSRRRQHKTRATAREERKKKRKKIQKQSHFGLFVDTRLVSKQETGKNLRLGSGSRGAAAKEWSLPLQKKDEVEPRRRVRETSKIK